MDYLEASDIRYIAAESTLDAQGSVVEKGEKTSRIRLKGLKNDKAAYVAVHSLEKFGLEWLLGVIGLLRGTYIKVKVKLGSKIETVAMNVDDLSRRLHLDKNQLDNIAKHLNKEHRSTVREFHKVSEPYVKKLKKLEKKGIVSKKVSGTILKVISTVAELKLKKGEHKLQFGEGRSRTFALVDVSPNEYNIILQDFLPEHVEKTAELLSLEDQVLNALHKDGKLRGLQLPPDRFVDVTGIDPAEKEHVSYIGFMEKPYEGDLSTRHFATDGEKGAERLADMAAGVANLHEMSLVHGDIKPEVIYCREDSTAIADLMNVGEKSKLKKLFDQLHQDLEEAKNPRLFDEKLGQMIGPHTREYLTKADSSALRMAFLEKNFEKFYAALQQRDIYCLGVTMVKYLCEDPSVSSNVRFSHRKIRERCEELELPEEQIEILLKMVSRFGSDRPTAEEVATVFDNS